MVDRAADDRPPAARPGSNMRRPMRSRRRASPLPRPRASMWRFTPVGSRCAFSTIPSARPPISPPPARRLRRRFRLRGAIIGAAGRRRPLARPSRRTISTSRRRLTPSPITDNSPPASSGLARSRFAARSQRRPETRAPKRRGWSNSISIPASTISSAPSPTPPRGAGAITPNSPGWPMSSAPRRAPG